MFTNILFLFLALLMPALILPESGYGVFESPALSFVSGLITWLLLCCAIWVQNKICKRTPTHTLIFAFQIQILVALAIAYFFFDFLKPFSEWPLTSLASLLMTALFYLSALGWAHYLIGGWGRAKTNILFLAPFVFPFVILWTMLEIPFFQTDSVWSTIVLAVIVAAAMLVCLPYSIQKTWRCCDMPESELKARLDALCTKLNFKHGGLKVWSVMRDTYTAAIIGTVAKYRYIMFTEKIIENFQPKWIEAILAHEIGHNKYRHLIYYPFITAGMVFSTLLLTNYLLDPTYTFFVTMDAQYPGFYWAESYHFVLYGLFALILGIAFRLFFGFFSRLFERQADLYIFEAGIDAGSMIDALNQIGNKSGYNHDKPNWHHYSIRERMNFLSRASTDPALIASHHNKVRTVLKLYFIALIIAATIIIYQS